MPVPVPLYSKPPAHPIIKDSCIQAGDTSHPRHSVFQHLTNSLPLPPTGPPPAFASREEWINSLPSWRRNKPRRIWEEDLHSSADSERQGFQSGLAVAGDAAVIKGAHAQAGIPPIPSLIRNEALGSTHHDLDMYIHMEEDADDEMSPVDGVMGWQGEDMLQFTDEDDDMAEQVSESGSLDYSSDYRSCMNPVDADLKQTYPRSYERGVFSPVLEDISDNEPGSSPVGPATPFADYVDRAVARSQVAVHTSRTVTEPQHAQYSYGDDYCGNQCYQCQHYTTEQHVQQPAPAPEPVITPTASAAYRKLAEPLADWMATFVWKVCTTGMSLPPHYAQPMAFVKQYPDHPPSHLARSTHSMLLSTLLQPSAVFLALWYIVRLPVFFGPVGLGHEHVREMRFRAELLGEAHLSHDREAIESFAPFRLILLGCMLANKWLDDHTFSNKTWHTISSVPIQSLNKLESLALDLFSHDLNVPIDEWSRWLTQLHVYHVSLSSPAFPQPISRPSTSPHNIIRNAIEEVLDASRAAEGYHVNDVPEPVFYGIEDGKKGTATHDQVPEDVDVLEIDLDEDGPLREEYMPKRRISGASNSRSSRKHEKTSDTGNALPPPAKWSPAADEPLTRGNVRTHTQYLAPQPIAHGHTATAPTLSQPPPAPFHQALDLSRRIWPMDEQIARHGYLPVHPPVYAGQPAYAGYEYTYPPLPAPTHSRSQSLSFNQSAVGHIPSHLRSYSHTRFEHGGGDPSFSSAQYGPIRSMAAPQWAAFPNRAVYPLVFEPSYDYSRPLLKV